MGKNKLGDLMRRMASAAGLSENKKNVNTSVLKLVTLVQKMTDCNIPDSLQVFITGHKNTQSLNNYRTLSSKQKYVVSNILSQPRPMSNFPQLASSTASNQLDSATALQCAPFQSNTQQLQPHQRTFTPNIPHSATTNVQSIYDTGNQHLAVCQQQSLQKSSMESVFSGSNIYWGNFTTDIYNQENDFNTSKPKRRRMICDSDSD